MVGNPPPGRLIREVVCDGGSVTDVLSGVQVSMDYGEQVSCTFVNDIAEPLFMPLLFGR